MNATEPFPTAPRVTPDLRHAFGGVWRLTLRQFLLPGHWLMLAVGLALLALLFSGGPPDRGTAAFLDWTIVFYATFLVPALAFMSAGGAMREELKSSSVDYVLTRPIPRPAFIAFKFVAHTLCLQLDFLLAFALVLGLAAARQTPELATVAPKLLFAQFLLVTAFSAFGFFCGILTTRYPIVGLGYAAIVEVGAGQIPTQVSRLSMTHQTREMLSVWLGRAEATAQTAGPLGTAGILLLFTVVVLGLGIAWFMQREFAGAGET
ncbi:MAG TPA: hypothetical protein VHD62_16535 [Opitutaceae bacterium]|nr:hypothetical protein [Opitutaceae bacterium]